MSVGHDREPSKTAELIICVVSELMRDQRTGLHMGAIWRIRLSDLYSAAMQAIAIMFTVFRYLQQFYASTIYTASLLHRKNIRISTDILWRVLHILTEPVPCTVRLYA